MIDPDICIDCGVCQIECPIEAILPDTDPGALEWLSLNREYSKKWPNIIIKKPAPKDAGDWSKVSDKFKYFDPSIPT